MELDVLATATKRCQLRGGCSAKPAGKRDAGGLARQAFTALAPVSSAAPKRVCDAALWLLAAIGWSGLAVGVATAQAPSATDTALPKFYSLKSNPVNLRKGPGTQFPKAWIYRREGLPVEVLREHERWRQVRDSDGATGWILRTLISQRRTALVAPWLLKAPVAGAGAQQTGAGAAGSGKLIAMRSGPRARANLVAQLEAGTLVNLKTCDGTWCQVSIGRFRGYVEQNQLWGIYPREILR